MAYSSFNKRRFEGDKPVTEGETYEMEIESTGSKGDGIGKVNGFVVIVPGAKEGQTVKVKVDAVRGKVAFGTMVGEASATEAKAETEETEPAEEAAEEPAEETSEEPETEEAEESAEKEQAEEPAKEAEEPEATEEAKKDKKKK